MKKDKIRISVVSYLNSRPFLYGLEQSDLKNDFSISVDIPSLCFEKLLHNEAEIGLIPVAMLPALKEAYIVTSYCIASQDQVESVLLVSQTPLNEIKEVILDTESRTSVLLAQLLAKEYWKIYPAWISQEPQHDFSNADQIGAAVMIGDKALKNKSRYKYCYDLSKAWKEMTGLPFVFAVWVSTKKINDETEGRLENAFGLGIRTITDQLPALQNEYPDLHVKNYLTRNIHFRLGEEEKKSMQLFLNKIKDAEEKKSGSVISVQIK